MVGASKYTFSETTLDTGAPRLGRPHVRALKYLSGVFEIVLPDYLRPAVTRRRQVHTPL